MGSENYHQFAAIMSLVDQDPEVGVEEDWKPENVLEPEQALEVVGLFSHKHDTEKRLELVTNLLDNGIRVVPSGEPLSPNTEVLHGNVLVEAFKENGFEADESVDILLTFMGMKVIYEPSFTIGSDQNEFRDISEKTLGEVAPKHFVPVGEDIEPKVSLPELVSRAKNKGVEYMVDGEGEPYQIGMRISVDLIYKILEAGKKLSTKERQAKVQMAVAKTLGYTAETAKSSTRGFGKIIRQGNKLERALAVGIATAPIVMTATSYDLPMQAAEAIGLDASGINFEAQPELVRPNENLINYISRQGWEGVSPEAVHAYNLLENPSYSGRDLSQGIIAETALLQPNIRFMQRVGTLETGESLSAFIRRMGFDTSFTEVFAFNKTHNPAFASIEDPNDIGVGTTILAHPDTEWLPSPLNYQRWYDSIEVQSHELSGLAITIDPGHGGGFRSVITDHGRPIDEHEVNYDTAMRLVQFLRQHGADVYVTVISPDSTQVLDNESSWDERFSNPAKNERHNVEGFPRLSKILNEHNSEGARLSADFRVRAQGANNFFADHADQTHMFISIHADARDTRRGTFVMADRRSISSDDRALARSIVSAIDANPEVLRWGNGFKTDQSLGLLRRIGLEGTGDDEVPALLVELDTMLDPDGSFALRNPEVRERYAETIFQGIRNHFVAQQNSDNQN